MASENKWNWEKDGPWYKSCPHQISFEVIYPEHMVICSNCHLRLKEEKTIIKTPDNIKQGETAKRIYFDDREFIYPKLI